MKKLYRLIVKRPYSTAWNIAVEGSQKERIRKLSQKYANNGWQVKVERI